MTTFRDNYALMIDISKYNPVIDWAKIKASDVAAVIIRSSCGAEGFGNNFGVDPLLIDHCQKAYDNDLPAILYHALDPGYYVDQLQSLEKLIEIDKWLPPANDKQWQTFVKAISFKKYYGLALDFEIYQDWAGKTITDGWLTEIARQWLIRLRKNYPLDRQIFYSAAWFVEGYAPSIEKTACLKSLADLWSAYYPYAAQIINLTDWQQLKAYYPPESMTINGRITQNPPFIGWDNWTMWQWTGDKFKMPGVTDANGNPVTIDLNFYNGTKDLLYKYLGFVPKIEVNGIDPQPVPVTPAPVIIPVQPSPDPLEAIREAIESIDTDLGVLVDRMSAIEAKLAAIHNAW